MYDPPLPTALWKHGPGDIPRDVAFVPNRLESHEVALARRGRRRLALGDRARRIRSLLLVREHGAQATADQALGDGHALRLGFDEPGHLFLARLEAAPARAQARDRDLARQHEEPVAALARAGEVKLSRE